MAVDPTGSPHPPLCAAVGDDQSRAAAAAFEERHVEAGRRLTTEGGGGYFFFVIEEGTADVTHGERLLTTFGPGDFFGETAIFETLRRTATVTTTSPATVLAMFGADFALLADRIPELRKRIDEAIEARLPRA
jgi:CRP-like cAMP-binding protein